MHRDVKPENIMFVSKGDPTVKLIDFGFATRLEEQGEVSGTCGTIRYIAPEVLSGRRYNESADMWSLGTVVYAMLTGRELYSGNDEEVHAKNLVGRIDWSRHFFLLSKDCQHFVR